MNSRLRWVFPVLALILLVGYFGAFALEKKNLHDLTQISKDYSRDGFKLGALELSFADDSLSSAVIFHKKVTDKEVLDNTHGAEQAFRIAGDFAKMAGDEEFAAKMFALAHAVESRVDVRVENGDYGKARTVLRNIMATSLYRHLNSAKT